MTFLALSILCSSKRALFRRISLSSTSSSSDPHRGVIAGEARVGLLLKPFLRISFGSLLPCREYDLTGVRERRMPLDLWIGKPFLPMRSGCDDLPGLIGFERVVVVFGITFLTVLVNILDDKSLGPLMVNIGRFGFESAMVGG